MILSSLLIKSRLGCSSEEGGIILKPYAPESQQPASYDLRAAETCILEYGRVHLVASMEWVELPHDIAATLRCRSSYARRGIFISGGFVDPGFRGHLTLCLANLGSEPVILQIGDRVVQMVFHEITSGVEGYKGRYQDSLGVVQAR